MINWILVGSIVAFFVVLLLATGWFRRNLRVPSPLERRLLKSAKRMIKLSPEGEWLLLDDRLAAVETWAMKTNLEQRVAALEERAADADNYLLELHRELEHWKVCTATLDLTPGPTASVTTPTSLKDVKVHMEQTQAPTT